MSKKTKRPKPKHRPVQPHEIDRWLDQATRRLAGADYPGVIPTTQRILRHTAASPEQRAAALDHLGAAHLMLQQFDAAYAALSQALALTPHDASLWYNRGLASRFTMRFGQALRDFERAAALESDPVLAQKVVEELRVSRQMVERELAMRGPHFTLEQLIAQEELFQRGVQQMAAEAWEQAEQTFRQVIAMGDGLPQPWGNLGACLIMQQRYDEAEVALRRALAIDSNYEFARYNLAALPSFRQSSEPPISRISGPFDGHNLKKSLTFRIDQ
jgi:tetratricopeptide (TPR) repeat protein